MVKLPLSLPVKYLLPACSMSCPKVQSQMLYSTDSFIHRITLYHEAKRKDKNGKSFRRYLFFGIKSCRGGKITVLGGQYRRFLHKINFRCNYRGKPHQCGYIERFNRNFRGEGIDDYSFYHIREAQSIAHARLGIYNNSRPYSSHV